MAREDFEIKVNPENDDDWFVKVEDSVLQELKEAEVIARKEKALRAAMDEQISESPLTLSDVLADGSVWPGDEEWDEPEGYGPSFKYDEDRFLDEVREYIASTYDQHYVGNDKERTQVVDLWESLGSLDTTSRDTAIKYLSRYGKKKGHNKVDLMKAIHYTILLWYATEDKQQ